MTRVRIKGFKIYKDRHGRQRCYHRATGLAIDLGSMPIGSAAFFAECARIAALHDKATEARVGTLGKLVLEYKQHPAFMDLAPKTKSDYERYFQYLKPVFDTPLNRFTPPLVVKIRDKAAAKHGRRSGNYLKTVLSVVFSWGKERGFIKTNPAADIKALKRPKDAPEANRPWTDNEREAVLAALPSHMRLPIVLMMYCGLDPQDAILMPKSAILDGKIKTRRGKTWVGVGMTIPPPVADEIERTNALNSDSTLICLSSKKRPWTVSGFKASWRAVKLKLEKAGQIQSGLTLKGLRHTVATTLAEMGYDERTIADVLGQKTIEMARHYSRSADKSRKMETVVKNFEQEVGRRKGKIV